MLMKPSSKMHAFLLASGSIMMNVCQVCKCMKASRSKCQYSRAAKKSALVRIRGTFNQSRRFSQLGFFIMFIAFNSNK